MSGEISSTLNGLDSFNIKSAKYLSRFFRDEDISALSCPDILEEILRNAELEFVSKSIVSNFLTGFKDSTSFIKSSFAAIKDRSKFPLQKRANAFHKDRGIFVNSLKSLKSFKEKEFELFQKLLNSFKKSAVYVINFLKDLSLNDIGFLRKFISRIQKASSQILNEIKMITFSNRSLLDSDVEYFDQKPQKGLNIHDIYILNKCLTGIQKLADSILQLLNINKKGLKTYDLCIIYDSNNIVDNTDTLLNKIKAYIKELNTSTLTSIIKKHKELIPIPVLLTVCAIIIFNNIGTDEMIKTNPNIESKSISLNINTQSKIEPLAKTQNLNLDRHIIADESKSNYNDIFTASIPKNNKNISSSIKNEIAKAINADTSDLDIYSSIDYPNKVSNQLRSNVISRASEQRSDIADIINNSKTSLSMVATAYDLSVESCGKSPSSPSYGITHTGTRATTGRTIAVDPSIIPLGSRVYISFPSPYKYLDGIYIAEDTGSKIKGDKIDIFFGEDGPGEDEVNNEAKKFGVRGVIIYIL
ncbi:MAG: 3D domain-containing protein [Bacillota bacterium]|nr:3D domain-containing protein [Bacillota bacterium]